MRSILSVICMLLCAFAFSQTCYPGGVTFTTQTEVDNFIIDNPTCTIIAGPVSIDGPITNLLGLNNITEIDGEFHIFTSSLTSFAGLEELSIVDGNLSLEGIEDVSALYSLTSVGSFSLDDMLAATGGADIVEQIIHMDDLILDMESSLVSLDIFHNLESVGWFEISSNDVLVSLTGFENVTSIGEFIVSGCGSLQILPDFGNLNTVASVEMNMIPMLFHLPSFGNVTTVQSLKILLIDLIENVDGLQDITTVVNDLQITHCPALIDFSGLDNLTSVGSMARFGYSENLISMNGLEGLEHVGGDLTINMCENLMSLDGLENLEHIGGDFVLNDTYHLTDISALQSPLSIVGTLTISSNHALATCDAEAVCEKISISPLDVIIELNDVGCLTLEEVALSCGLSSAEGSVIADFNCDQLPDVSDQHVGHHTIFNQDNVPIAITNDLGNFTAYLPDNSTTSLHAGDIPGYSSSVASFTTNTETEVFPESNIFLCPDGDIHNTSIGITASYALPVPGFTNGYHITVSNYGVSEEDAVITFSLSNMPGATAQDADGGLIDGDMITWNVTAILPFHQSEFDVVILVDPSTPLETIYTPMASVTIEPTEIDDADNIYSLEQTVVGSYDPNDKIVSREQINFLDIQVAQTVELEYTIHFQNVGTSAAVNVRIEDDIEENLDMSAFEMISASHDYSLTFDDDHLTWLFENINLADSASDEENSHGYVHFRISTQPNLLITDTIENTASIFFDFNEPVITNTAVTSFYDCPATLDIIGDIAICETEELNFQSSITGYDDYNWIVDGQPFSNEESIVISDPIPGEHGIALLISNEDCLFSQILQAVVDTPANIDLVYDDNIACNSTEITANNNGEITWTLDGDPFSNEDVITITESGLYSATVINACGTDQEEVNMTIVDGPVALSILNVSGTLNSSQAGTSYQWYLDGNMIEGATTSSYTPTETGDYSLQVFFETPCELTSDYVHIVVGMSEMDTPSFAIWPNPVNSNGQLQISGNFTLPVTLTIYNMLGEVVQQGSISSNTAFIELGTLSKGLYQVQLGTAKKSDIIKVVVE